MSYSWRLLRLMYYGMTYAFIDLVHNVDSPVQKSIVEVQVFFTKDNSSARWSGEQTSYACRVRDRITESLA